MTLRFDCRFITYNSTVMHLIYRADTNILLAVRDFSGEPEYDYSATYSHELTDEEKTEGLIEGVFQAMADWEDLTDFTYEYDAPIFPTHNLTKR